MHLIPLQDGCGLLTAGGYYIFIQGENFGTSAATVIFGSSLYSSTDTSTRRVAIVSDAQIQFLVPPGAGSEIPVYVKVGSKRSLQAAYFSYDPPYVSYVSPNNPDAEGEGK